jgi:hypothetical protein
MQNQIVRMFSSTAGAERAREELLAEGFDRLAVELWVREDEAGAMQGNFTVGDNPRDSGGHDYRYTFAHRARAGGCCCMIMAATEDAALADRGAAILERLGATEPGVALKDH